MFGRPRCREWTPLTTQQLRLRSLIQIVGYNIRPPEPGAQCGYYVTLHHTPMSAPFYTSERIFSPHPKWKEIDPEITQRMSSTNVVIRIWSHTHPPQSKDDEETNTVQDTVIETWGVYFSGLRYLGANLALNFNSDCFKSNTLVFQMHGGYFCSYKSLKLDIMPPENGEERKPEDQGSVSSGSSGQTVNCFSFHVEAKKCKQSRSASPGKFYKRDKEYSKSQSPVERGFKQNFPTIKSQSTINVSLNHRDAKSERSTPDPNHIFEHSPNSMDVKEFTSEDSDAKSEEENRIDLSETAENYDLRNESDAPKYRYIALNFLKSEIRPSYNATKLRNLHLLQYAIKKKQEAVQEIKEKIYKKSAITESMQDAELRPKSRSTSQRNLFSPDSECNKSTSESDLSAKNGRIREEKPPVSLGPRLTLKLNDLLSFKSKPSPFQRSEHVRMTRQLEILHFKRLILSDERDTKLANIRRLKERHAKLFEENQDVGSELMQHYHSLSRCADVHGESRAASLSLREAARLSHAALAARRARLLQELHQIIFTVNQKDSMTWTICDVPLPVCGDENPASNPLPDAVAAGYVAQATCLASTVLNQPLRYKITLLGSATKIQDIDPDLPDPNIPLFARGGDTTLFRYAMFLLNKCVAQLLWGRALPVHDMRPTLANLQRLLTAPTALSDSSRLFGSYRECPRTQSLRSVMSDRSKYRQFNRFKDTVDGQSPQKALNSRHKQSRSVGSYQDDQELSALNVSTTSVMGSDSNIYSLKQMEGRSESQYHKTLSDSEISNHNMNRSIRDSNNKVVFTMGDDTQLKGLETHLVRISTNNDDKTKDNVKRICSEITNYCTEHVNVDVHAFDIAKHITSRSEDINEFMKNFDKCKEMCADFNAFFDANASSSSEASGVTEKIKKQVSGDIDIAKYMEKKASVDVGNADVCELCNKNVDGVCDLACANSMRDVIVIPSAEAILDTGQDDE